MCLKMIIDAELLSFQDGAFYRAIVAINREQWSHAQSLIELTRELLDTEVTALSLESYQRAYPAVVCVQVIWKQCFSDDCLWPSN